LRINELKLLSLVDGFFFRLREGGGHVFGKEGNKGFEKLVKALFLGGFSFAETTSPMPFMNVVSDVCSKGLFKL
jgi:hypothetical protein